MASVLYGMKQPEAAIGLLAQAARIALGRADVQKLVALAAGDLDALEDSLAAWERYLKLAPEDDFARRERAYTAVRMGNTQPGIQELERFLARNPGDADGHFELGVAQGNRTRHRHSRASTKPSS